MNKVKKTSFADRLRKAWRAFCNKPASSIALGIEVKRCDECEYRNIPTTEATEQKYFTPDDVRRMTRDEVRENYTAIRKSMEKWK